MADPAREVTWLRRVCELSHELAQSAGTKDLFPRILEAAIELTGAERGLVVRLTSPGPPRPHVRVESARGFTGEELRAGDHISRTVVARVLERGERGIVTTSDEDEDLTRVPSVHGRGVTCLACVPMRLRGEVRGVLYLDHRGRRDAFQPTDLPALRAFADVAALALETAELRGAALAEPLPALTRFGELVGAAPAMRAAYEAIERCARSWDPVLISGETGTGKRLAAREVHRRGSFPDEPLCEVACAGDPGEVEARLMQAFLQAGRGTLVLVRPDALPGPLQERLVRVLHEGKLPARGPVRERELRCRVVALGDADLRARVAAGALRSDLYYRLDVLRVSLPPLRERAEDVPLLVEALSQRLAGRTLALTGEAMSMLQGYGWPGNVRELENEVRRLMGSPLPRVPATALSPELRAQAEGRPGPGGSLRDQEREAVLAALRACGGNKARAAQQLGVSRSTLYRLLERYQLEAGE